MDCFVQRLDRAKKAIDEADFIVIGAGAVPTLGTAVAVMKPLEIPESVYDNLIETVHEFIPVLQDYLRLQVLNILVSALQKIFRISLKSIP